MRMNSFYHFLFGFMAIIAVAFGVLIWASPPAVQSDPFPNNVNPVDNVALPQ